MSASTIDPAITRLSNPQLYSDATAKAQIFSFVPARNFQIEIALKDSSATNPALDLTSAIVDWEFTPVDPDDYPPDDEDDRDFTDDEDDGGLDEALDSELDDENFPTDLLGFLDLTFLLSKDTLIQAALLRESACIDTTVLIRDANDAPLTRHTFKGLMYPEDVLPVGSADSHKGASGSFMTASIRIRIFDCTMWGLL